MIFDSHAHYEDKAFDDDRDDILKNLPEMGVCNVINVGTDVINSRKSVELAEKYPYVFSAVGIHPQCVSKVSSDDFDKLFEMAKNKNVVAIGEIGLDYHYGSDNKDLQIEIFENQVLISKKLSLPIIVHDRDAHMDTLRILNKHKPKGVVHCFSGSLEFAKEILKLGMFIGIGGLVTFKNAKKIVEVVKNVSLESILLETDAPYMTPEPFRGKRCDSSHIRFTAEKIAQIKDISYDEVLFVTRKNAMKLFCLEETK